ncbi:hypothetical protein E5676_scaffold66G00420 [Cucumis melo var. makuwa]|uniref:Pol protein n=1 Tax=Cucumis melo var. makuwa TaxID=1194695 RepID=A0A5D3CHW6_CUCMM|nr:hypothetical protein E5676_scaffold66G00420 [Cucumis melo var. makuwa]
MPVGEGTKVKANRLVSTFECPGWKWKSVSMDFITGLPRTLKGYTVIWVVVDRLTKSAHFIPGKSTYTASEVGAQRMLGPELVQTINVAIQKIRACMLTAQSKQKSYIDEHRKDIEFDVGDMVFLKVAPMKGVIRFEKKGKLSPLHDVFHISMLRKNPNLNPKSTVAVVATSHLDRYPTCPSIATRSTESIAIPLVVNYSVSIISHNDLIVYRRSKLEPYSSPFLFASFRLSLRVVFPVVSHHSRLSFIASSSIVAVDRLPLYPSVSESSEPCVRLRAEPSSHALAKHQHPSRMHKPTSAFKPHASRPYFQAVPEQFSASSRAEPL